MDLLVYRIGFACETHYYDIYAKGDEDLGRLASLESAAERDSWIEENIGSKEDVTIKERWIPDKLENCLHSVKVQMEFILSRVGATGYRGFLTGKGNFREDLVDYYKANRKDARKPTYYKEIGEYLVKYWDAEVVEGQEADDALGIAQMKDYLMTLEDFPELKEHTEWKLASTIICTIDKDLDNIPGWHYNFVKDEKYWVTEEEALINFYTQLLTGDSTDNIPGLFRITGLRASKEMKSNLAYCETEKQMWDCVLSIYISSCKKEHPGYGLNKAYFTEKLTEIGRLLWIRQEENQMWEPPSG